MKTYSVTLKNPKGIWITNFGQFPSPDDINWELVKEACKRGAYLAYGYQYGNKSRNLISKRTRTVLWRKEHHEK